MLQNATEIHITITGLNLFFGEIQSTSFGLLPFMGNIAYNFVRVQAISQILEYCSIYFITKKMLILYYFSCRLVDVFQTEI